MQYTVIETILPGTVMERQVFDNLEDALKHADISIYSGPSAVEISVVDELGVKHLERVLNANRT
ncbi:hypothetical protein OEG84_08805 [Hoeflea sp. G2-23]|uniref:Uncharacterized protein n=1 Tax=Hoeflea algicola TaxID=2983763 RepID=A0ABT3Z7S7_9HYPH|nr:hypothetical protein [Hoeflea algicola]MCY0147812.1 hypothetical protein [Hoeflea algicola]